MAAGLKLKPSKCFFFKDEIEYLGHVVGGKGIFTNPKKIEAVTKWPTPKTVYDIRSFLGLLGTTEDSLRILVRSLNHLEK